MTTLTEKGVRMTDEPGPGDLAVLVPAAWKEVFRSVPREFFIPDAVQAGPMGDEPSYWVDRTEDPDRWRAAVYADTTLLTQIADGTVELSEDTVRTGAPSSSSTAPSLVGEFLALLDPYPGRRVPEVGTGTGWTAALLSERLGADSVTSVEVDEQVSKVAADHLEAAGYRPSLVVGDGLAGFPEGAPYDRVHVTCAVREVPFAWVEQIRPGGVIVAPWSPVQVRGHKLRLRATGGRAIGRLHGGTAFMVARSQRPGYPSPQGESRESEARLDPMVVTSAGPGLEMVVAALLPGVVVNGIGEGDDRVGLHDPVTGAYALAIRLGDGGAGEVTEYGPRDLWSEMEAAYLAWVGLGEPELERFGLTVDAEGRQVWLDQPRNLAR
ncbi:methyltransferase domain-containing protein [Nocardiopsis sp. NPDC055824]